MIAAKAAWEANKCGKHHCCWLKGKARSKRRIPMNSVKTLAAGLYRLQYGHEAVGMYLECIRDQDGEQCWWHDSGGRTAAQMGEHLFQHSSQSKTSSRYSGKRCGRQRDGEWADADMCKSLSCSPWRSAIKQ